LRYYCSSERKRQYKPEPRDERGEWVKTPESPQANHRGQGTPAGWNSKVIIGARY